MKLKLDTLITDLDNRELSIRKGETEGTVSVGEAAEGCLMSPGHRQDKMKAYDLAVKIHACEDQEIELSLEETLLIEKCTIDASIPIVMGCLVKILEGTKS